MKDIFDMIDKESNNVINTTEYMDNDGVWEPHDSVYSHDELILIEENSIYKTYLKLDECKDISENELFRVKK